MAASRALPAQWRLVCLLTSLLTYLHEDVAQYNELP
jgi:hypothetical protein